MDKWLIYLGTGLVALVAAYGLYASASALLSDLSTANVLGAVAMLGVLFLLVAGVVGRDRRPRLSRLLLYAGSGLVAAVLIFGLYSSALIFASSPSPANAFAAMGMLGLLLVLGGTALQKAKS
jgi:hypothetical protein